MVKTLLKNPNVFDPPSASVDFVHVLQNFPKHFKITQREKCAEFQGTQLCCWVALLIWRVGWWKWLIVTTRPGKYRTIAQTNPLWSLSDNKVSSCH
jgi:hypothetical protein